MAVHPLHVAGRKDQDPSLKIFPAKKIDAALPFFSALGHLEDIQQIHKTSFGY
jgi:hypothetical protein